MVLNRTENEPKSMVLTKNSQLSPVSMALENQTYWIQFVLYWALAIWVRLVHWHFVLNCLHLYCVYSQLSLYFNWIRCERHRCKSWFSKMDRLASQRHRWPLCSTTPIPIIVPWAMKTAEKSRSRGKFVSAAAKTNTSSTDERCSTNGWPTCSAPFKWTWTIPIFWSCKVASPKCWTWNRWR